MKHYISLVCLVMLCFSTARAQQKYVVVVNEKGEIVSGLPEKVIKGDELVFRMPAADITKDIALLNARLDASVAEIEKQLNQPARIASPLRVVLKQLIEIKTIEIVKTTNRPAIQPTDGEWIEVDTLLRNQRATEELTFEVRLQQVESNSERDALSADMERADSLYLSSAEMVKLLRKYAPAAMRSSMVDTLRRYWPLDDYESLNNWLASRSLAKATAPDIRFEDFRFVVSRAMLQKIKDEILDTRNGSCPQCSYLPSFPGQPYDEQLLYNVRMMTLNGEIEATPSTPSLGKGKNKYTDYSFLIGEPQIQASLEAQEHHTLTFTLARRNPLKEAEIGYFQSHRDQLNEVVSFVDLYAQIQKAGTLLKEGNTQAFENLMAEIGIDDNTLEDDYSNWVLRTLWFTGKPELNPFGFYTDAEIKLPYLDNNAIKEARIRLIQQDEIISKLPAITTENYEKIKTIKADRETLLASLNSQFESHARNNATARNSYFSSDRKLYDGFLLQSGHSCRDLTYMRHHNAMRAGSLMGDYRDEYLPIDGNVVVLMQNANAADSWSLKETATQAEDQSLVSEALDDVLGELVENKVVLEPADITGDKSVAMIADSPKSAGTVKYEWCRTLFAQLLPSNPPDKFGAKSMAAPLKTALLSLQCADDLSKRRKSSFIDEYKIYKKKSETSAEEVSSHTVRFTRLYYLQPFAGIGFAAKEVKRPFVETLDDGTLVLSDKTEKSYFILGLKVHPFPTDIRGHGYSCNHWYRKFSASVALAPFAPADHLFAGINFDIVPGLSVGSGWHLYRYQNYTLTANEITDKTTGYKQGLYFSLTTDAALFKKVVSLFKN